ncbi:hypothetical protein Q7W21_06575 [Streptococcus suis]|nr:hypothetical protein [Streptococcus suis]MDW8673788.1 hypothetical protein [Streptococcus suis]MDW8718443.1 hypothetical protein [Streptococcus suis]MDW8748878.1 hypothetical protein [Streptococcus suis]MDW8753425.1 hypothetical protein [Streptococcus suis]
MTFKKYLQNASKRDIYDDGKDFDYETIFAREVLRYACDVELETKDNFFRHLEIMNADKWFIELAHSVYQDYEKSSSNFH